MRISIAQQQSDLLIVALRRLRTQGKVITQATIASQIKVSEPFLSGLISGRKKMPARLVPSIGKALYLTSDEIAFLSNLCVRHLANRKQAFQKDYVQLNKLQAAVVLKDLQISILTDLLTCQTEEGEPIYWTAPKIAQHLGLRKSEVQEKLGFLVQNGLVDTQISEEQVSYSKSHRHMRLPNKSPNLLFKFLHQDMIKRAHNELNAQSLASYDRRMMTSATVAIDPKKIPEAKKRVQAFLFELIELMTDGTPQEVYLVNFNLFPALNQPSQK